MWVQPTAAPSETPCNRLGHHVPRALGRAADRALACDNALLSGLAAVFSGRSRYGRCSVDEHGDAGHDGLPPALDLRMLGPLEAWRGGQQLSLGGQRQRSVLACLLLQPGHAVSSDRIIDAVWGARPPSGVQTTLQTYVFHLRDVLEPARVRGTASGVIATVPGGARLEESRAAATELWVDAEMALGHHDVLGVLDDLVGRYPLREHLAAMRMLALYRAGRQADALSAYRMLRHTLDEELGIQPSA